MIQEEVMIQRGRAGFVFGCRRGLVDESAADRQLDLQAV